MLETLYQMALAGRGGTRGTILLPGHAGDTLETLYQMALESRPA
jgi:hypothetical protein